MLTQKQEAFCLAYIETGNASESYRRVYQSEKLTDKSVHEMASRLLKTVKVRSRLEELRAPVREKALLTLETHLERLDALSRAAESDLQFSAAITAETNRGKAAGLYTEKVEIAGKNGGPIETATLTKDEYKQARREMLESDDC